MDELNLIREIGADTPEPETLAVRRARTRLLDTADREHRRPLLRRPLVRIGAAAAAVALIAGGVVVGDTFWRDSNDHVVGAATAAEVLRAAADGAIRHEDPVVGHDQYLKITRYQYLLRSYFGLDGEPSKGVVSTTWRPGDPDALWVHKMPAPGGKVELKRARNGEFVPRSNPRVDWTWYPRLDYLAELPRDVSGLKERFKRDHPGTEYSDIALFWDIAYILQSGIVPAELRAVMFSVLETLPTIEVLDESAEIGGRTGVAIGWPGKAPGYQSKQLIVDPDNGLILGDRTVFTADTPEYKKGEVLMELSITTEVVDSAP